MNESLPPRRRFLGLFGAALGMAAASGTSAQEASGTTPPPRKGWARTDGRLKLKSNGNYVNKPSDVLAIHQTFALYGMAHDEVDGDVMATLFIEQGIVELARASGTPFLVIRGRQAIVENVTKVRGKLGDQRRHCMTNILVERVAGGKASAIAYCLVSVADGDMRLGDAIIYTADLEKGRDGVWRFSRLFVGIDGSSAPRRG